MGQIKNIKLHIVTDIKATETKKTMDYQGGKKFGEQRKTQEMSLDQINATYLEDDEYLEEYPNLKDLLSDYKDQFIKYDRDNSGDINEFELKLMMEKLDQAKTHLELKKMIKEVDREGRGAISYNDFLYMMLGGKNSVLKLILKFEKAMKGADGPTGPAPKRSLASLP